MKTPLATATRMHSQAILLAALLLLPLSNHAHAEDIDIYSGNNTTGTPNVLFIMDNAANFDSATSAAACTINGATNTMAKNATTNSAGGIEQCALYTAISQLPVNTNGTAVVSIGFMLYNGPNVHDYTGANCGGSTGGCLAFPLTPMTATLKTTLMNWIAGWTTNNIKTSGAATAATMQEAWAYYAGKTGLSTRNYSSIQPAAGCQKNFVIYLGNAYTSSSHPGDASSGGPQAALTAAYALNPAPNNTPPPLLLGTINTSCGSYTFPSSNHENPGMYADEWARFMHNTDVFTGSSGTQSIITYTIGLLGSSCPADYPALLYNMGYYGGGKYFAASDPTEMLQAILNILNEVQAVNSVFSSASLPVSVNTQGTYLNQIYMGMFRPDASGNPRWVGNLKQYQFALDTATTPPSLFLSDAVGKAAISAGGTGFITPGAMSFWSCASSSRASTLGSTFSLTSAQVSAITCPSPATTSGGIDPIPGFFASTPDYVANTTAGAFDLQDGQIVEKGGVSQQIRLANLIASYPPAAGGTDSPRKLYIYCPSGSGCVSNLTDPSNAFSVNNLGIQPAMFGASSLVPISSIVRTGTNALVTTTYAHGFTTGNSVSITGAIPSDYNVTQNIIFNSPNTFTITGLGDYPNTPSTGTYTASVHNSASQAITSVTVTTSTTANANACTSGTIPNINCNQVTVTLPGHGYINGNSVVISGVNPSQYSGTFTIGNVTANTFTYNVSVTPSTPSVNAYSAQLPAPPAVTISNITNSGSNIIVTAPNTFTAGQSVTISGNSTSGGSGSSKCLGGYNGTFTVSGPTSSTFNINASNNGYCTSGSATLNITVISIPAGNISRASATSTTATASGITASAFSNGQTVNLQYVSGSGTSETTYAPLTGTNSVVISCSGTCTSFTFPITLVPSASLTTSSPSAALAGNPVSIPAGAITRSGTTVTVTGVANSFTSGNLIDISPSGSTVSTESAYNSPTAGWPITCAVTCGTSFTFGPVSLTPTSPATGTMYAYSGSTPPDKTTMINWIRGQDNRGDEQSLCPGGVAASSANAITGANYANCPATPVTIRPSVHGDVLHSRPITVNYGGSIGVVVYYGSNDGIYHAVNGNQTTYIGTTPPGGELWGYLKTDFLGKYSRQRTNSPVLKLPGTPPGILPAPMVKDYFIDGPTGLYQLIDGNGSTTKANIYLGMRRGGRVINAFDVTNPTIPVSLWKLTNVTSGTDGSGNTWNLNELGQTWSLPRVTRVKGYANPVLIFGAGYDDGHEDQDPPAADTMGRGIYIMDAITGALVWQVTPNAATVNCSTTLCQKQVAGMVYSIPSDITMLDKDSDGYVERLYATDTGGNVWRVDLEPSSGNITPNNWQVTKLAALGCANGVCASGTTPRKFFYPAETFSASSLSYDVVMVGSGDREHPLYGNQYNSNCTNCAYSVSNRLYMLQDVATGNDGSALTTITEQTAGAFNLDDCTGTISNPNTCSSATTGANGPLSYDRLTAAQKHNGYYITLTGAIKAADGTVTYYPGEKTVNAPLFAAGYLYFGTNQPVSPSTTTCTTNLGIARGYRLDPFSGNYGSVVYEGGGMPPSPVSGVVDIVTASGTTVQVPFVIGGATPGCTTAACLSPVSGGDLKIDVPTNRHRNYWYIEGK